MGRPLPTSLVVTKDQSRCCWCCCRRKTKPHISFMIGEDEFEQGSFMVSVEHPLTGKTHQFHARTDEPELTLAHVMSWIMFDEE